MTSGSHDIRKVIKCGGGHFLLEQCISMEIRRFGPLLDHLCRCYKQKQEVSLLEALGMMDWREAKCSCHQESTVEM